MRNRRLVKANIREEVKKCFGYVSFAFLNKKLIQKQTKKQKNKRTRNKTKNKTKQNKTKQNKTKQNKTKQNKTKQNKTKQNKTKQNKTKQNKTKQNKTKQNKTKQNNKNSINRKKRREKNTLVSWIILEVIERQLVGCNGSRLTSKGANKWKSRLLSLRPLLSSPQLSLLSSLLHTIELRVIKHELWEGHCYSSGIASLIPR